MEYPLKKLNELRTNLIEVPFSTAELKVLIPKTAGLYALWWDADIKMLESLHRKVSFQGKQIPKDIPKSSTHIEKNERYYEHHTAEWNWNMEETPVCMYVGKSTNLRNRIKLHWEYGKIDWYNSEKTAGNFLLKHTTACQMRSGVEHLFKNREATTLSEKLKYFKLSYMPLAEEDKSCFIDRFYLEDLAIGYFRPWFNLDSER